jgi:A/G-specific adenine glycosylase
MKRVKIPEKSLQKFNEALEEHKRQPRHMPWRNPNQYGKFDPYKILVSEVMLQQTQVNRVIPKFELFMQCFPTVKQLDKASLGEVLACWSGLGYNRRAKYLHDAADGLAAAKTPWTLELLCEQKGIGPNTAKAVLVYSYNQPEVFIETNIRTVYIHHFFPDDERVTDAQLTEVVAATLDTHNPRIFYWALMDYGTELKRTTDNFARKSKIYRLQSQFKGSTRQVRGNVIRLLTTGDLSFDELQKELPDPRLKAVIQALIDEKLIEKRRGLLTLPN